MKVRMQMRIRAREKVRSGHGDEYRPYGTDSGAELVI